MQMRWLLLLVCGAAIAGCSQDSSTLSSGSNGTSDKPVAAQPSGTIDSDSVAKSTEPDVKRDAGATGLYSGGSDPKKSAMAEPATSVSSQPASAAAPNADLLGSWKGEIKMEEPKKDDPSAAFAGLAKAMLGNIKLEFKDGNRFAMNMMIPFEGSYTRSGRKLTLKVEKVMGMTPEEAAKMSGKGMPADANKPMNAELSADGKTITVKNDKSMPGSGEITFRKAGTTAVKSTVNSAEQKFVGEYKGFADIPKNAAKNEKERRAMEMLKDSMSLELRADNTYALNIMLGFEGKWKLAGDRILLDVGDMGLAQAFTGKESVNGKSKPMELLVTADGGLKLVDDDPKKGSVTFRRK
jgi:hypothetical protein